MFKNMMTSILEVPVGRFDGTVGVIVALTLHLGTNIRYTVEVRGGSDGPVGTCFLSEEFLVRFGNILVSLGKLLVSFW